MKVVKVNGGESKDFFDLCEKLQNFQYSIKPDLKEKGYILTDSLQDVTGFVLYINNKPVGSIGLRKVKDDTCEIVRVFVDESYRCKGYATMLFDKIETLAKEMGFKNLEITAWCFAESAVRLYKKLNYICSEEKTSEWYGGYKYVELFKTI